MGRKEFQSQFSDGNVRGASWERRPDAVSPDYLTALAPGPRELQDPTYGLLARAWYCRVDNDAKVVYIAKAKDNVSLGWEPETPVFSFSGDPIDEISMAFDQNGAPVFVAQRGQRLWIRYFKPSAQGYVFEDFGDGRSARCILDDPSTIYDSDIVVFYIRGGRLKYRVQRDLYAVEYDSGVGAGANDYIEKIVRGRGKRVHIIIARRNTNDGTYQLDRLSSGLYPLLVPEESVSYGATVQGIQVDRLIIEYSSPEESVDYGASVLYLTLKVVLFDFNPTTPVGHTAIINQVTLVPLVIIYQANVESVDYSAITTDLALTVIMIVYESQAESVDYSADVLSLELFVP